MCIVDMTNDARKTDWMIMSTGIARVDKYFNLPLVEGDAYESDKYIPVCTLHFYRILKECEKDGKPLKSDKIMTLDAFLSKFQYRHVQPEHEYCKVCQMRSITSIFTGSSLGRILRESRLKEGTPTYNTLRLLFGEFISLVYGLDDSNRGDHKIIQKDLLAKVDEQNRTIADLQRITNEHEERLDVHAKWLDGVSTSEEDSTQPTGVEFVDGSE